MQRLERAGIPFAPINQPTDLFEDPHLQQGEGLIDVTLSDGDHRGQVVSLPAIPVELGDARFGLRHDLPAAGEDAESLMSELGFSAEEIGDIIASGAVRAD